MAIELLNEKEASSLLRLPVSTLQFFRRNHRGPVYLKLGRRVYYRSSALEAWMQESARAPDTPA